MWPFVSEKIMHACGQLKTNINKSRIFALDAESEKSVTPTLDRTTEIVPLALINFIEF